MFHKIAICSLVTLLLSCSGNEEAQKEITWSKEQSTEMNKDFAIEEDLRINAFLVDKPKWKMTKTDSGLRYFIYKQGTGAEAISGKTAQVKFNIQLLDGTQCYKTDSSETEDFLIDKSEVETGIQEGIKKMKVGDKAKLIVPSHLAHGLLGDLDKIPPLTTIVVDLELIGLK